MRCVPGGPAVVGSDGGPLEERPRRVIEISTFYMDETEITVAQYRACEAAGACPRVAQKPGPVMRPFLADDQPMVPLDALAAERYCAWAGKRLPTEWEWEKAARGPDGELYPWGNDAPSCDKAHTRECAPTDCERRPGYPNPWDCTSFTTLPVTALPPQRYGLRGMAGNGFEWTATWVAKLPVRPESNASGLDPWGPCDGISPCPGHDRKVLRGGSWYWPREQVRASFRRFEVAASGEAHRLSARCATSYPWLTRWPPRQIVSPAPEPGPLAPPDAKRLARFRALIAEDEIMAKPLCDGPGRSHFHCRDRNHYVVSNEPLRHLWGPHVRNLGGGYVGIASDQNYSLIAEARSEWAWIFDYDPVVVSLHKVLLALIRVSENPDALIAHFGPEAEKSALKIVADEYPEDPELKDHFTAYRIARNKVFDDYRKQRKGLKEQPENFGWLHHLPHYAWIRTLVGQGRIRILKGDMTANGTMRAIAEAARAMGVPIRVYYPSNAPEMWNYNTKNNHYRANVRALPFDERSVVVQTVSGIRNRWGQSGHWHYNVQWGLEQQQRLGKKGYDTLKKLLWDHAPSDQQSLSVRGLPSD